MRGIRLLVVVIVVVVLVVVGHDAYEISKAHNDVRNAAQSAAATAAGVLTASHGANVQKARSEADATVKRAGDVITGYTYDPVARKVTVKVGGTATSWVAGRVERSWTDNITASASASPSS